MTATARQMNLSKNCLAVLELFREEPGRIWYGYMLTKATGIPSGSLCPALKKLEDEGLLQSEWEAKELSANRGKPRRYYRLAEPEE